MTINDTDAIRNFNVKKHYYLAVVDSGTNKHLEAKHVSCIGRIFMKLGYHKASMKNVIKYLENNIDVNLRDKLKTKLLIKLQKYEKNHNIKISSQMLTILTTKNQKPDSASTKSPASTAKTTPSLADIKISGYSEAKRRILELIKKSPNKYPEFSTEVNHYFTNDIPLGLQNVDLKTWLIDHDSVMQISMPDYLLKDKLLFVSILMKQSSRD